MDTIEPITNLAGYGQWGVMIALILLAAGAIYLLYKFASNHVLHSNTAFNKNTEALTKVKDSIDSNTRALGRFENTQKKIIENLIKS